MNRSVELAKNSLILALGKLSAQLVSLLLLPLYTFYLSPKDVGLVDLIVTYAAILAPILTVQLDMAVFRHLVEARNNEDEIRRVITNTMQVVGICLILTIALGGIFSLTLGIKYFGSILFIVITSMILSVLMQIARGVGDNSRYTRASIINSAMMLIGASILMSYFGQGVQGVLTAMSLANIISTVYLFIRIKIYKYIVFSEGSKNTKKQLLGYSLPLIPNGLSWWVIGVSDRTIISIFLGLAANGLYAVSAKYAAIYSSIFAIFSLALTESISLHINSKGGAKFIGDVNRASLKLFGALGLILISISPFVFNIFVGPEFKTAVMYVPILIIAGFLSAIVGTYSAIYVAKKLTKQVATTSIFAAVINIVMTLALIKLWGIYAAATATALAYLAMAIYRHHDIKKYISLSYEKGLLIKIGSAFVLVCALFYINNLYVHLANVFIAAALALSFNSGTIKTISKKIFTGPFKLKRLYS